MGADFDRQKGKKRLKTDNQDGLELQLQQQPGAVILPSVVSPSKNAPATVTIEVEEIPLFVNGIVFCRDHKMLNKIAENSSKSTATPGYFNLRHLIQHENYLDIK